MFLTAQVEGTHSVLNALTYCVPKQFGCKDGALGLPLGLQGRGSAMHRRGLGAAQLSAHCHLSEAALVQDVSFQLQQGVK